MREAGEVDCRIIQFHIMSERGSQSAKNVPSFAKVSQPGDDIRLFVKPFVNPSCDLFNIWHSYPSAFRVMTRAKGEARHTTRRLGYFVQKFFKPSGADI